MAKKQKLGKKWKMVRKEAVNRDGGTCLKCNTTKSLSVHHVLPKSLYPEKTFDLNNLRTLCCDCHAQLHREIALASMCPSERDRFGCPGSNYFDKWLKAS